MNIENPVQPLIWDNEIIRFKKNAIVRFLLDTSQYNLNKIAEMDFSDDDREQFAQLIGYSLSGFSELSYATVETIEQAEKQQIYKNTWDLK